MVNFWLSLPRPFFVLAPMEDVTDAAFRRLIAHYGETASTRADSRARGRPDVMFSEFTSADGIAHIYGFTKPVISAEFKNHPLGKKLLFSHEERPIVAQLFSAIPERMEVASVAVAELGFDGIDLNMGCPDRAVEKSGCGAALMKDPARARDLIRAAKKAGLPVSVKTRTGYAKDTLDVWLPELLAEEPAAITIHARTRKELSDVPAHWDAIARAVGIRNKCQGVTLTRTLIIGNGDVEDIADAHAKAAESGCDGVMLGRAIYGNPFLFSDRPVRSLEEKLRALLEHVELFEELLGGTVHFAVMKKHFKAYVSGFDGAKELRIQLMEAENVQAVAAVVERFLGHTV